MPDWVFWMIAAGVLAVGEIFTLSFFLGPIAVAALVTAGVAALGAGVALQIIVFTLVSIATVGVLRPVARRHLRTPARLRSGTAALVGESRRRAGAGGPRLGPDQAARGDLERPRVRRRRGARARRPRAGDADPGRHGARDRWKTKEIQWK